MARRPESETILTREQLADFTRQLQRLSDDGVERIYERTYRECAFQGTDSPASRRYSTGGGDVEGSAEVQSDE
jgi:hypothetical protein